MSLSFSLAAFVALSASSLGSPSGANIGAWADMAAVNGVENSRLDPVKHDLPVERFPTRPGQEMPVIMPSPPLSIESYQVRIERRVILRIAPHYLASRETTLITPAPPTSMKEVKTKTRCMAINALVAVKPTEDNRLLLFLRDQKIYVASLEKLCSARDFYSGFYIEPSADRQLCVDRENIQSRTGALCKLTGLRQIVRREN